MCIDLVIPGASALEVMDFCEKRILQLGGGIAWGVAKLVQRMTG